MSHARHLAAIMFADIVGYTAIMQKNEHEALKLLNRFKELIEELTPANQGKIVQYFGDGGVLTFDSSTDCVNCAMALQNECNLDIKIPIRIGLHLGEVIFQNNNIFGDGVNIASRVESMGVPGAILMSKSIRDQIKNKSEFRLASLGGFAFKNVEEPMEVFALANEGLVVPKRDDLKGKIKEGVSAQNSLRLAAIMSTDIVGFTALNKVDEHKAKSLLKKNRAIQKPLVDKFRGKWLKESGDDIVASFGSAADAVSCAKEIIQVTAKEVELSLRIGIHIGDVEIKDDDVWGDGIDIVTEIQELAPINGILISSGVNMNVASHKDIRTRLVGEERLKSMSQPVKLYLVEVEGVAGLILSPRLSVSRTEEVKQKTTGRQSWLRRKITTIAISLLLLLSIGYVVVDNLVGDGPMARPGAQVMDKSIAVLPFENLSAEAENQYFADGQTEAILNHLTKIADLRVISRTTMMSYSGTNKSVPMIARELGVRYVLEGSVQKFGQKVRINAQLIDSDSDKHLWSNNFDRDLTDIFSIQTEIAQNVAEQLQATISNDELASLVSIPTSDLSAYDFYLKGQEYLFRSRRQEDFRYASQMFRRAVELDDKYTLAWVGLSAAQRWIYWFQYDRSKQNLNQIREYLNKATRLEPELMEVQLETASYYYHCERDYPKALQILNRLGAEYPKNDQLHLMVGAIYRRMGNFENSLENMEKALALNSRNWVHWLDAGGTLNILGRYSEAAEYFENAINLNPSEGLCYVFLGLLHLTTGETAKAIQLMKENQHLNFPGMTWLWSQAEIFNGNYQQAAGVLLSSSHAVWDHQFGYAPKALQLGFIYRLMGDESLAMIHFKEARRLIENKMNELEDDSRLYSSLGLAYAGLGMQEEALQNGNRALELMNISVDAWKGFYRELDMARIMAMVGQHEEAVEKLQFLLEQNGYMSVQLLENDPFWDPLREQAGFDPITINN